MFTSQAIFVAIAALLACVAAAPVFGPAEQDEIELVKRQQRFATQYWANDQANLTWVNSPAGQYSVDWKNPSGGNFVVGKGYRGQGM